jgi:hypothetical protein
VSLARVVKYNHCLFPSQPPDQEFTVSFWDATKLLLGKKAILLRWPSEFDRSEESAFWYIIKDSFVPLESLGKNRRAEIRKGLRNYDVRLISQDCVANYGYPVYCADVETVVYPEFIKAIISIIRPMKSQDNSILVPTSSTYAGRTRYTIMNTHNKHQTRPAELTACLRIVKRRNDT